MFTKERERTFENTNMKKEDLKYLLELLDDEQEEIRKHVLGALSRYGGALESDLREYSFLLDKKKEKILAPILKANRNNWFRESWLELLQIKNEREKLEVGMSLISAYQSGRHNLSALSLLLNELANEFLRNFPMGNELELASFLFNRKRFRVNFTNVYEPENFNLPFVIHNKNGAIISLFLIYYLIAKRLGLKVEGFEYSGHFLAKVLYDENIILIDFSSGVNKMTIRKNDKIRSYMEKAVHSITTEEIMKKVLQGLILAYKMNDKKEEAEFFNEILLLPF